MLIVLAYLFWLHEAMHLAWVEARALITLDKNYTIVVYGNVFVQSMQTCLSAYQVDIQAFKISQLSRCANIT